MILRMMVQVVIVIYAPTVFNDAPREHLQYMCHLQSSLTTVKMFLRVQATGNIFEHIKYWLNANIFTNGFTLVKFAKVALQNCYKMLLSFCCFAQCSGVCKSSQITTQHFELSALRLIYISEVSLDKNASDRGFNGAAHFVQFQQFMGVTSEKVHKQKFCKKRLKDRQ